MKKYKDFSNLKLGDKIKSLRDNENLRNKGSFYSVERLENGGRCMGYLDNEGEITYVSDTSEWDLDNVLPAIEKIDMVNNPKHYTQFPIELKDWNFAVIETIKNKHWAAYFKTASEYLHRAHLKNGVEDIEKLIFWMQEAVKLTKEGRMKIE